MPKILISNSKGLYQKAGTGGAIGLERVLYQVKTIAATAGDNIGSWDLPAKSLVTEVGFAVSSEIDASSDGGSALNLGFHVGTDSDTDEIIAEGSNDTIVDGDDAGLAAGAAFAANLATGVATAVPHSSTDAVLVAGAPLYSSAARTLYYNFVVNGNNLDAAGEIVAFVKYTTFDSSESSGV